MVLPFLTHVIVFFGRFAVGEGEAIGELEALGFAVGVGDSLTSGELVGVGVSDATGAVVGNLSGS
jgi:hypothetical protein